MMKDFKFSINYECGFSLSQDETLAAISEAGFHGVFPLWSRGFDLKAFSHNASLHGLAVQSVHGPFYNVDKMWEEGEAGDDELSKLIECLSDCKICGVPLMICHVYIGSDDAHPTEIGAKRYRKLLSAAEKLGVRVAFENTEGEGYLEYLRDQIWDSPMAGFCIDTGHEMCYNRRADMIKKYGASGKLFCTHLNDNFGMTGDGWTPKDDSHVLPFDGTADWESIAARIREHGLWDSYLTLELTIIQKPERNTHERYSGWDFKRFYKEAYSRAEKLKSMI